MISLVSLLVTAALVSQHSGFETHAELDNSKLTLDNNLLSNVIEPSKKSRRLKNYVHIWSPPVKEVERVAGERVELECIAIGNPPPAIRWMKNGEVIQDYQDESNQVNKILPVNPLKSGNLTSKLIITSATPGEDQYTCEATAGLNEKSASSVVYTLPSEDTEEDQLSLQKLYLPSKPTITYYYTDLCQEIGSVAVLPCRVHSFTKAQVFWQDRNQRPVYGNPRMKVLPSGDLYINDLRWEEDFGDFTCTVKNAYGKDVATTFLLPVLST